MEKIEKMHCGVLVFPKLLENQDVVILPFYSAASHLGLDRLEGGSTVPSAGTQTPGRRPWRPQSGGGDAASAPAPPPAGPPPPPLTLGLRPGPGPGPPGPALPALTGSLGGLGDDLEDYYSTSTSSSASPSYAPSASGRPRARPRSDSCSCWAPEGSDARRSARRASARGTVGVAGGGAGGGAAPARGTDAWRCLLLAGSALVALSLLLAALGSADWLRAEEVLRAPPAPLAYNGTRIASRRTVSGLWTICQSSAVAEETELQCCAIEYFSRDPFGAELQDAVLAIPYAATHAASFFVTSLLLMLLAEGCWLAGTVRGRDRLLIFASGVLFVLTSLVLLVGLVVYVTTLRAEAGELVPPPPPGLPPRLSLAYGPGVALLLGSLASSLLAGAAAVLLALHRVKDRLLLETKTCRSTCPRHPDALAWRDLDGVLPNGPAYVPALTAAAPPGSGPVTVTGPLLNHVRGSMRERGERRRGEPSGYHSLERHQYHSPISAYGDLAPARPAPGPGPAVQQLTSPRPSPRPSPAPSQRQLRASCSSLPLKRDASVDPLVSGEDWSATVAQLALVSGAELELPPGSGGSGGSSTRYNTWGGHGRGHHGHHGQGQHGQGHVHREMAGSARETRNKTPCKKKSKIEVGMGGAASLRYSNWAPSSPTKVELQ
ncbi:Voltage-dependent calcium channel gamma-5 subunit [Frankliniella fusca]|uniref:Voltage-dependent calcium channel gamma-5 subunit n=1 Tax=Frankliniella fusca TaxID=407009 RepID=A0AAE1LH30_9NEOP|nr:Voltage-dependent calcium channel gamma-5 subunit [Frankliniella fusca]